jgi:CubicO group peptidase (beta-lactamase class C family)
MRRLFGIRQLLTLLTLSVCLGTVLGQTSAADKERILAAGYKAGVMCSVVFLGGRDPADVIREELAGPVPLLGAEHSEVPVVDYKTRSVTCSAGEGLPSRLAVHREGYGTVLLPPGATLADVSSLPQMKMPFPKGDPAKIPWPDGDLLPQTAPPANVDQAGLKLAVDNAFGAEKYGAAKTLSVVVVYRGRIIAERYAPGRTMHTQYRSWSSAKSITSALVGIMVGRGKLKVSDPAPITAWRGDDPRRKITIENLLHMSSGLKSQGAATIEAYWGGTNTAELAAGEAIEAEPGTRWKYANYDTLLLMRSIKEVLGDQDDYLALPRRVLLNKIGMRHTYPEIDPFGNFILSSQVYTTARDLARFGLLYLQDGVWNGERILPEGWVKYTQQPAPAKEAVKGEQGYGAQFWLMNFDDRVPADAYTTAGARGQFSTIVPSRDVVVVRTGLDPSSGSKWSQEELVADVLKAID